MVIVNKISVGRRKTAGKVADSTLTTAMESRELRKPWLGCTLLSSDCQTSTEQLLANSSEGFHHSENGKESGTSFTNFGTHMQPTYRVELHHKLAFGCHDECLPLLKFQPLGYQFSKFSRFQWPLLLASYLVIHIPPWLYCLERITNP